MIVGYVTTWCLNMIMLIPLCSCTGTACYLQADSYSNLLNNMSANLQFSSAK